MPTNGTPVASRRNFRCGHINTEDLTVRTVKAEAQQFGDLGLNLFKDSVAIAVAMFVQNIEDEFMP